jgi:hypothetical protein
MPTGLALSEKDRIANGRGSLGAGRDHDVDYRERPPLPALPPPRS